MKVRRRAWQGREVPLEPESWALIARADSTPQQDAETSELLDGARSRRSATTSAPTSAEVLVAVTIDDVPIDVLAERLDTTRGALYKTIHDARRKLRGAMAARGLDLSDTGGGPS